MIGQVSPSRCVSPVDLIDLVLMGKVNSSYRYMSIFFGQALHTYKNVGWLTVAERLTGGLRLQAVWLLYIGKITWFIHNSVMHTLFSVYFEVVLKVVSPWQVSHYISWTLFQVLVWCFWILRVSENFELSHQCHLTCLALLNNSPRASALLRLSTNAPLSCFCAVVVLGFQMYSSILWRNKTILLPVWDNYYGLFHIRNK